MVFLFLLFGTISPHLHITYVVHMDKIWNEEHSIVGFVFMEDSFKTYFPIKAFHPLSMGC